MGDIISSEPELANKEGRWWLKQRRKTSLCIVISIRRSEGQTAKKKRITTHTHKGGEGGLTNMLHWVAHRCKYTRALACKPQSSIHPMSCGIPLFPAPRIWIRIASEYPPEPWTKPDKRQSCARQPTVPSLWHRNTQLSSVVPFPGSYFSLTAPPRVCYTTGRHLVYSGLILRTCNRPGGRCLFSPPASAWSARDAREREEIRERF
jgi:hypothetical protein